MRSPVHTRLLLILLICGLAGFVGLLALSSRVPAHADVVRFLAIAWFLVFGAARLLVQLDEAVGEPDEALRNATRLRGRGDL